MLDSVKESCLRYCYWVGDTLKRLLCIVSVSAFSISLAVTLYGGLYWAILPSSATSITVKWDFTSCQVVGQPCSYIRSVVGLARKQMVKGNRYNVELLLDLPDSPANRDVGMFLVCTSLLPSNITTCNSAMVPYRSLIVTSLESILLLPLHMARLTSSTSVLSIPLLENHTESDTTPTTSLQLELQTSKLQVSSSRLKIWPCDLCGVRYLMYHHPLLSTLLGVTTILTITCLTAALAIAKFLQPHRVVVAPRTRSNHDLADRQARARLNQEYRQARLRETRVDSIGTVDTMDRGEQASTVDSTSVRHASVQSVGFDTTSTETTSTVTAITDTGSTVTTETDSIAHIVAADHQKLE